MHLDPTLIKGTVSVFSSDPTFKNGSVWFTMVPLKALTNQVWTNSALFSTMDSFQKWLAHFFCRKTYRVIFRKRQYLLHYRSGCFSFRFNFFLKTETIVFFTKSIFYKGTFVNLALYYHLHLGGWREIMHFNLFGCFRKHYKKSLI